MHKSNKYTSLRDYRTRGDNKTAAAKEKQSRAQNHSLETFERNVDVASLIEQRLLLQMEGFICARIQ